MKKLISAFLCCLVCGLCLPAFAGSGVYLNPVAVGTKIVTLADVSCTAAATLTVAADDGQVSAMLANVGSGAVRCGDSNVSASQGVQLAAATGTATFDTTAAIYCYCATASTISITKVER
jgi:hypothetical protein